MLSFTNIVFMTKHLPLPIQFNQEREITEQLCKPLSVEDYATQIDWFASPPKWHLAHTTWFFESFVLEKFYTSYRPFDEQFAFLFNSYYISKGNRLSQSDRGSLAHPSIDRIYEYRRYVNRHIIELLESSDSEIEKLIILGLNHEQQHQELLLTDLKLALSYNPLLPTYNANWCPQTPQEKQLTGWQNIDEGVFLIGYEGDGFYFDNELNRHKTYIQNTQIRRNLVSNIEYLEFMSDGGYNNPHLWHSDGWDWVQQNRANSPMYWQRSDDTWQEYTLKGLQPIEKNSPVSHINYYEASAFTSWCGYRLPTEFEWEVASTQLNWGQRWEWTQSAYLPYPGFNISDGAVGEYNGKFMINQMVLRGASIFTSPNHSRHTYRNFFHPQTQWQMTGIRLAR